MYSIYDNYDIYEFEYKVIHLYHEYNKISFIVFCNDKFIFRSINLYSIIQLYKIYKFVTAKYYKR